MNFLNRSKRTAQIFVKMWRYLQLSNIEGANYRDLKKRFSRELIRHLHFQMTIKLASGSATFDGPAIYVCNHLSYMDIPVMMSLLPDTSFVSKSEVAAWPIIGRAARRIDTIFVKRECRDSRENTRLAVTQALNVGKKKIVVFPSSTTSIYKTDRWRKGIFEIAHAHGVPVIPLRLQYQPLRQVAYIDDDHFMRHLMALVAIPRVEVSLELGAPVIITDPVADCARIKAWSEAHMAVHPVLPLTAGLAAELANANRVATGLAPGGSMSAVISPIGSES